MRLHQLRSSRLLSFACVLASCGDFADGGSDGGNGTGGPANGVKMSCINDTDNYHWDRDEQIQNCNDGMDALGCPVKVKPPTYGEFCIPEDTPGFDLDNWVVSTEMADSLYAKCNKRCQDLNFWNFDQFPSVTPVCESSNYSGYFYPVGWDEENPELNCNDADDLYADPDGSEIDWSTGGTPVHLPLSCDLDDDCGWQFDANIAGLLAAPGPNFPIGADQRRADYYSAAVTGTALEIDMPGTGSGVDDTESLSGFVEFSAADCGDDTCPFYLANLHAFNSTDTWDIEVTVIGNFDMRKEVKNVSIHLLQPVLGIWNTNDSRVVFPTGTLRLGVSFEIDSCSLCSTTGNGDYFRVMTNDEDVFGSLSNGDLSLSHEFSIQSGTATLTVETEKGDSPPVASIDLDPSVSCDDPDGFELTLAYSTASDPDDDIESETWVVDGEPTGDYTVLSVGTHVVSLVVSDTRGAVDTVGPQTIEVDYGAACL